MKVCDAVRVEWMDSCEPEPNADIQISDIPEPQKIISLGFILTERDEYITIAGNAKPDTIGKDNCTYDYVTTIPRVAIIAIEPLHGICCGCE